MKRSYLDMALDVLDVLSENGATGPTHIHYKANLEWHNWVRIRDGLSAKGLILKTNDGKCWALTDQGLGLALSWRRIKRCLR